MIAETVKSALGYLPGDMAIEMCVCRDSVHCPRKKPNPGMVTSLLERFGVAPPEALLVGDLAIDAEAAGRAGVRFCWAGEFFGWTE